MQRRHVLLAMDWAVSGVFQRTIDGPLLETFFPGQPVMAYFEFSPGTSAESARVVEDVIRLAKARYRVDAGELGGKLRYGLRPMNGM